MKLVSVNTGLKVTGHGRDVIMAISERSGGALDHRAGLEKLSD